MIQHVAHKTRSYWAKLSPGVGEHILAEIDAESLHLGEEAVHLRRRGVVVGVVVGAEEAALTEEALLVAALALRVGLGVEVGVEVELGDEGARRQRDDASELGEALSLSLSLSLSPCGGRPTRRVLVRCKRPLRSKRRAGCWPARRVPRCSASSAWRCWP